MIQFEGHTATVCSLAFSPDSMTLASGAKDGGVKLWDAAGGLVREYPGKPTSPPQAISWSPSGSCVATAFGGTLRLLLDERSERLGSEFEIFSDHITSLAFLSVRIIAYGTGMPTFGLGTLHLWDTQTRKSLPVPTPVRGVYGVKAISAHSPTKRLHWIAGLPNTTACIWRSWCITSPNATDVNLNKPASHISVSPDGGTVAIASDWLVRVLTADGKPKTELSGHKGQVACVRFIHGGRTVVSASWDETVRFWDLATGQETARFALKVGKLTALSVSPDETRIAVGGTDGPIVVLDAE